ncbi:hypothetical protein MAPG_02391 [Magnaporthiopsis poae ATCC 64411]|uniref:Uncharacterized protein n=1 Tax=Magnaporthiopsis poae (strain ATCC 64411 / 73-15) TaxID=644358 RepID=A0A0C4DR85_MAGP6|nr:hypothetical protein MAPG_02391 [Magnaporthiopsis poae ATCC 64411]
MICCRKTGRKKMQKKDRSHAILMYRGTSLSYERSKSRGLTIGPILTPVVRRNDFKDATEAAEATCLSAGPFSLAVLLPSRLPSFAPPMSPMTNGCEGQRADQLPSFLICRNPCFAAIRGKPRPGTH